MVHSPSDVAAPLAVMFGNGRRSASSPGRARRFGLRGNGATTSGSFRLAGPVPRPRHYPVRAHQRCVRGRRHVRRGGFPGSARDYGGPLPRAAAEATAATWRSSSCRIWRKHVAASPTRASASSGRPIMPTSPARTCIRRTCQVRSCRWTGPSRRSRGGGPGRTGPGQAPPHAAGGVSGITVEVDDPAAAAARWARSPRADGRRRWRHGQPCCWSTARQDLRFVPADIGRCRWHHRSQAHHRPRDRQSRSPASGSLRRPEHVEASQRDAARHRHRGPACPGR